MLPGRLTTVTFFGSPELASEDLRRLQEAGLNPYLGGGFHGHHCPVEIRVPESELEKALAILELDPIESPENSQPQTLASGYACARVRTADSYRLPPCALYVLVVSVAVLVVALICGQGGLLSCSGSADFARRFRRLSAAARG